MLSLDSITSHSSLIGSDATAPSSSSDLLCCQNQETDDRARLKPCLRLQPGDQREADQNLWTWSPQAMNSQILVHNEDIGVTREETFLDYLEWTDSFPRKLLITAVSSLVRPESPRVKPSPDNNPQAEWESRTSVSDGERTWEALRSFENHICWCRKVYPLRRQRTNKIINRLPLTKDLPDPKDAAPTAAHQDVCPSPT